MIGLNRIVESHRSIRATHDNCFPLGFAYTDDFFELFLLNVHHAAKYHIRPFAILQLVTSSVYIETTIISYLTAKPSRDLIVAAHQQVTSEWWANVRPEVECFVSPFVIDEATCGDDKYARKRLEAIADFSVLQ